MSQKPAAKIVHLPRRAKHARHPRWDAAVARLDARMADVERRLARLDRRYRRLAVPARMRNALVVSILLHLFIILGVTFKMPDPSHLEPNLETLEVVLVNAKSQAKPLVADALAQHNLDGGGNTDDKRRAQSPLPVLPDQQSDADVKLALKRVERLEREARQLMTQKHAQRAVDVAPTPSKAPPQPEAEAVVAPDATDILRRSVEIARLEAKISRDWDAYQQRPRRKFLGARTQEFRFARYIEDWRQKIERVGEMNYPQAARDQRVHGSLIVTVAIRADGTVEQVDITRPSGFRILDDAARRIVQLAAPFAPLPPEITRDVDILHITRTWTFTPADRFVSE